MKYFILSIPFLSITTFISSCSEDIYDDFKIESKTLETSKKNNDTIIIIKDQDCIGWNCQKVEVNETSKKNNDTIILIKDQDCIGWNCQKIEVNETSKKNNDTIN